MQIFLSCGYIISFPACPINCPLQRLMDASEGIKFVTEGDTIFDINTLNRIINDNQENSLKQTYRLSFNDYKRTPIVLTSKNVKLNYS